jgi:hypothetical protein
VEVRLLDVSKVGLGRGEVLDNSLEDAVARTLAPVRTIDGTEDIRLADVRIPVKATGESSRRRPPSPVEGDQFGAEPSDARLIFIGKVAYRVCSIKSVA